MFCHNGKWITEKCSRGGLNLVHPKDKKTAGCVPIDSLQCGSGCAKKCECEAGEFLADSCEKYKYCVDGHWKTTFCNPGMVHLGDKSECTPVADLQCGTKCAPQCECKAGDFEAESCEKFKVCNNGSWETTICDPGMVNLGKKAGCVPVRTLKLGSKCAPECDTGAVEHIDCNAFKLCKNQKWETENCKAGFVHLKSKSRAQCSSKAELTCDSECAEPCKISNICDDGAIKSISCSIFKKCVNGDWATTKCPAGFVRIEGSANCMEQSNLACHHKCSRTYGKCPKRAPPMAPRQPPKQVPCPKCQKCVDHCSAVRTVVQRLQKELDQVMNDMIEEVEKCHAQPYL